MEPMEPGLVGEHILRFDLAIQRMVREADAVFGDLSSEMNSTISYINAADEHVSQARQEVQTARLRAASTEAHLADAIKRFGERTQGIYGEIHPGQRVPSPPLRDEDYSGPPRMTLDAIFAPRRSGETDAAFADRQQR